MEQNLVYAKTPLGEEAVRQSTRVVQRNLRMVLVQVDGKLTVGELAAKIGNVRLVETALKELADGGYIAPGHEALAAWEEGKKTSRRSQSGVSALSQLSEFGPRSVLANEGKQDGASQASSFSTFGKPIAPVSHGGNERDISDWGNERPEPPEKIRQIPTRGIFRGLLVLLVIAILGLALFPYDRFRPEMEVALGNAFQATVKVGDVRLDVFPIPQLVASNIRVGDSGEISIERMVFASPFSMLTSGASAVKEIRVAGVKVFADRLAGISVLRNPGQLKRVMVERMSITAGPMVVSDLGGEIALAVSGGVEKIELQTAEKSLRLDARPSGQSLALSIEGYGWRPISDVAVAFDNMRAKAVLKPGRLLIEDIDSTFMGGALKGNFVLDWNAGISMAGDANLARIDVRKVAALWAPSLNMEGEIAGNVHLHNTGNNIESFWNSMEATMSAEIARGVVHGLDLGEVARRGAGYAVRSGSTKFDTLRADLTLNPSQFVARNIQMNAGMLTSNGQLVVQRNLETDGNLVVNIHSSVSSLRVPVKVSGSLNGLIATAGK